MQKNTFTTERLKLREITEKDTNVIVGWRKNPDVYKYFRSPHELTYEEHMKWYSEKYVVDDAQIHFIAVEKVRRKEVGVFSVRKCINQEDCVEVSYLLDIREQGKGYAQEAVLGMMRFAQEKWGVKKAIAEVHKNNYTSQKMIQKMGFEQRNENDNFLIFERILCYT